MEAHSSLREWTVLTHFDAVVAGGASWKRGAQEKDVVR